MLGAIAGDVIGSVHEFIGTKTTDFPLFDRDSSFTDDTVLAVAPAVAYAFDSLTDVLAEAARSAEVTHNHAEGIKGAQTTAAAVFLARRGGRKDDITASIEQMFGYDLSQRLDDIRPTYRFDESCQRTVPPAIIAFLESMDFEDAVRKAISLGRHPGLYHWRNRRSALRRRAGAHRHTNTRGAGQSPSRRRLSILSTFRPDDS
jgi:ADP-ribosylglycohydrolase